MPKSKRSKVVSLTKVSKKTREHKEALLTKVQENAARCKHCWVFEVGAMRNAHLKTVRSVWKDSARIFFGRAAVMAKALGATPEEEHRPGVHQLARHIKGQVGLLFTATPPDEVSAWFADFKQPDFARAGNTAARTVLLPAGSVMRTHTDPPEAFAHNEEPQLRRLGLATTLQRGVPTLAAPHRVCEAGCVLTAEQAQLLKLLGERMVMFRVVLRARWDAETGEVVEVDGGAGDGEMEEEADDGEMITTNVLCCS